MDKSGINAAGRPFRPTRPAELAKRCARLAVSAAFATAVWTGAARAQDVAVTPGNPCATSQAPDCQQVVASGTLGRDGSTGWAVYCPPSAPYWWNNWTHKATRVTSFTPNPFAEAVNKFDVTITNWSALGSSDWAVAIDCSPIDPNGNCKSTSGSFTDPGCPQSNKRQVCSGEDENEQCWYEWAETCVSGTTVTNYQCTQAAFKTYCDKCQ